MPTAPGPADTGSARAEALAWAASFREHRSALRRRLSAGELTLADVLAWPTSAGEQLGQVRLLFVLESLPSARKVDTRRRLAELGVGELTPLAALTGPEREQLLANFPLAAPGDRP